jgi:site-specific DNA-methyltransferase (adenine-specific)
MGDVLNICLFFARVKSRLLTPSKIEKNKTAGQKKSGTIRQKDGSLKPKSSIGKVRGEYSQRFNIWECKPVGGIERSGHPAPFPEQLANDHIISWSNEGDIVFDPFLGSGTTAKMAVLNNRHYIGFELDPQYFQIASERIKEAERALKGENHAEIH